MSFFIKPLSKVSKSSVLIKLEYVVDDVGVNIFIIRLLSGNRGLRVLLDCVQKSINELIKLFFSSQVIIIRFA